MTRMKNLIPALAAATALTLGLCALPAFASDASGQTDTPTSPRFQRYMEASQESGLTTMELEIMGDISEASNAWDKTTGGWHNGDASGVIKANYMGIDVSHWQNTIDWAKVAADGVDFAIISCGYGNDETSQDDSQFLANVKGAQANGIRIGVYIYSYAYTNAMAKSEAEHCLRLLKAAGLSPSDLAYPVYYDLEETIGGKPGVCAYNSCDNTDHYLSNTQLASMTKTWSDVLTAEGYSTGVYASLNWWNNFLTDNSFAYYERWVAQWYSPLTRPDYSGDYTMWQAADDGKIDGIVSSGTDIDFDFGALRSGWFREGGNWYFYDANGNLKTGWVKANGFWYYLNSKGVMLTGWIKVGGRWFYLDEVGAMQTGWLKKGSSWYYLADDGAMATGWAKVGGHWYYFNSKGVMLTGWLKVGGRWFHLASNGAMDTGLTKVGGYCYWFCSDGHMGTGWVNDDGDWRRFDADGHMMIGWTKSGGSWYYLNPDGTMAIGWAKVSGKWYNLGTDGKLL